MVHWFKVTLCLIFVSYPAFADKHPSPELEPIEIPARPEADPLMDKAWHLRAINAPAAWNITLGNASAPLAIIDSGVNYNHQEITANLWKNTREILDNQVDDDGNGFIDDLIGWDFVRNRPMPYDYSGHGTLIAAIAAGLKDNGQGAAGVCPKCSLMSLRFINWEGLGDTEDAIKGINYAIDNGAKVLNLSFAGEGTDDDLLAVLKKAEQKDVFVVAAAGNDGANLERESIYPAKYQLPNMVTIAASTRDDQLLSTSNYGTAYVQLAAPGEDIVGPWFEKWDTGDGTSMAAPIVAAAASMMRSVNPNLTAKQTKNILIKTVRRTEDLKNKVKSGGILDLDAAVRCAKAPSSCLASSQDE